MAPTSAVVVTYNSADFLDECLAGLMDSGVHRVVVVENGSKPEEKARVRETVKPFHNVDLLDLDTNFGFGGGVNRGVKFLEPSESEVLCIVNPDTVFERSDVAELSEVIETDEADIVSPAIWTSGASGPKDWFRNGILDEGRGRTIMRRPTEVHSRLVDTNFVPGTVLFMWATVFQQLGGFDEGYFMYWEDADFCRRARQIGLSVRCVNDVEVWHAVGGSFNRVGVKSPSYFYYMQRNRLLFLKKIGQQARTPRRLLPILELVVRAFMEPGDRWSKIQANLVGIIDGLNGKTGRWVSMNE